MRYQLVLLSSASLVLAKSGDIIRGVGPENLHLYTPNAESIFSCKSHPEIHIPSTQVNDDYCDCPDGSDEPGTSACSSLPPRNLSLPGFYCMNAHHTPLYLPFSRVNDGVCDYEICCDGSDEYDGVGGVVCENRCKEIGKIARKEEAERKKKEEYGRRRFAELVGRAQGIRQAIEQDLAVVRTEIEGLERTLETKKNELTTIEVEESSKVVKGDEKKGRVSVLAQLAKERIEEYKDSTSLLLRKKNELAEKLSKTEAILKAFKDTYNPNFNDEGVKTAVRAWEEYLAANEVGQQEEDDVNVDNAVHDLLNEDINWEEWEGQPEEDTEVIEEIYQIENYLPTPLRSWIHSQLNTLRTLLIENGILADRSSPPSTSGAGASSPRLASARSAVTDLESKIGTTRSRIDTLFNDLNAHHGAQDVFRALKETCIDVSSGGYTYEHCFWSKAWQTSNKDGSRTHLGDFSSIEGLVEEDGSQSVLLTYKNGARCWNGPARSAIVRLRCSAEEVIETVFEEEKCVYKFEAGSAAVCGGGGEAPGEGKHDEL